MKLSYIIKCCLNPKVLGGILLVIVLVYLFAPQLLNLAPFLLLLICPLSMGLMMAQMRHEGKNDQAENLTKDQHDHSH